jgi:hypothetical protein
MSKAGLLSIVYFICALSGWGQDVREVNPRPYDKTFGRGYTVVKAEFTYPPEEASLAYIDYKNYVLHTFDSKGKHWTCGQLRDGSWEGIRGGPLMAKLTWRNTFTLGDESASQSYALIIFDYFSGVGFQDDDLYAQIWELHGNQLKIIQQLRFNIHLLEVEESYSYDPAEKILKARATHYLPGEAHCCASAYDELVFHWSGSEFKLTKKETKPIQ